MIGFARLALAGWIGFGALAPGQLRADEAAPLSSFIQNGDSIPEPLEGRTGDPEHGRATVLDRSTGNCLICHKVPIGSEPFQGELGPDLTGIGARLSTGQIRLRLVDLSLLDAATLMPPYYRTDHLTRVADKFQGRPILDAQQIEDVVVWLASLKEANPDRGTHP